VGRERVRWGSNERLTIRNTLQRTHIHLSALDLDTVDSPNLFPEESSVDPPIFYVERGGRLMSIWTILQVIVLAVVFPSLLYIAHLTGMSAGAVKAICIGAIVFLGIAEMKKASLNNL
jgi:hypothetical protein